MNGFKKRAAATLGISSSQATPHHTLTAICRQLYFCIRSRRERAVSISGHLAMIASCCATSSMQNCFIVITMLPYEMLRLSTCQYIDEGHHVILKGASGNGKTYIACALGNATCRRFKKVSYIRMPELLDELSIARNSGELKKLLAAYKKADLLILDEWLIRPLSAQESYDLLEIAEARCKRSMIFCTQYQSEGWYTRIDPNPESDSPVSEAIMDRIIHNAYEIMVEGRISMRERKGLKAASSEEGSSNG